MWVECGVVDPVLGSFSVCQDRMDKLRMKLDQHSEFLVFFCSLCLLLNPEV